MVMQHRHAFRMMQERLHELAAATIACEEKQQPERWAHIGHAERAKRLQDEVFHLRFLAEAMVLGDEKLFLEHVGWAKICHAGLHQPDTQLDASLHCLHEVLREYLPADSVSVIKAYLESAIQQLAEMPVLQPSFLHPDAPLASLASAYLDALLSEKPRDASLLIFQAVEQGTDIKQLYLHVFQPTQYEIGRLWQMGNIGIAQEHYCTAATRTLIAQLFPRTFARPTRKTLIVTCIEGELHELGAHIVSAFMQMVGWETYDLGANTPSDSVLQMVQARKADLLAISATMPYHVHAVEELITRVHAAMGQAVKILVGGYPFNIDPLLWQRVGADGSAHDAQGAVDVAKVLLNDTEAY